MKHLRACSAPSSLPSSGSQPQPPPRRPGGSSLHGRYGSERDLSRPASQRIPAGGRQYGNKPVPASRQNQLERSPQELPVKDTDQPSVCDVVSAPRKFFTICNQFRTAELLRICQLHILPINYVPFVGP